MKLNSLLFVLSISFLANSALANTGSVSPHGDWSWVTSISAGPTWASGGNTQTFYLTPEIEKTYKANKSNNILASGELFLGIQKPLFSSQLLSQIGLMISTSSNANLQGNIWDDADSHFDNYTYKYQIRHSAVALKGILLVDKDSWLPWISASVGAGFNYAHAFSNTPTIFEALSDANFSNNSKTSFTYTLGIGIQKPLSKHWQLDAGYEFADWGQSELGRANNQTLNSGLTLNHLYTNSMLLNLTYLS
jgi:opacity protein-like surface antigen